MTDPTVRALLHGLLHFEPEILLPAAAVPPSELWRKAAATDPRVLFYVQSIQSSHRLSRLVFHCSYTNTETPLNCVWPLKDLRDASILLTQALGQCQPVLGLVTPPGCWQAEQIYRLSNTVPQEFPWVKRMSIQKASYGRQSKGDIWTLFVEYRLQDPAAIRALDAEAQQAAVALSRKLFKPYMSRAAKCRAAHDWLASQVIYGDAPASDEKARLIRHSAYGPLIERQGVCEGIADAFSRLMRAASIEQRFVCGDVIRGPHAWNLVRLPGQGFLHVDVTWDLAHNGVVSHKWYCLTDGQMFPSHQWDRTFYPSTRTGS